MTDRTHPEAGSTHIIRYALELGLLWIDGSGRDKVREALDALDTLEAQLEAIGAGGVQEDKDLQRRCVECVEWQQTGELREGALRAYAKKHWPWRDDSLQMAERATETQAMRAVASWGTHHAPPAEQPQPHYSRLHDADAVHGKRLSVYSKPTAEQQAQPGAVGRTGCTAGTDEECTRRGCATSCPALQAAPKAAPGEPGYRENWDAELGRTAMRFVDRAGDVHPGIDDAETICAEFYRAMSEVIERMPHVQRMTPRKAAPVEQNTVPAEWLEQAYREGWAACRDAETIGEEAEDWAFGNSTANSRMIDAQQAAPQQEAPLMPKGESAASKLRAMAANYPAGHLWDKLDAQACAQGAMEIEALRVAPQQEAQEPALFVSAKQLAALTDPDDPDGEHGRYLPVRKTTKGLFTQALYTAPQPAPAPATPDGDELRRIARSARTSASDDAGPTEYVLAGWKAAMLAASPTPPAEQQAVSSAVLKAIREANMQLVRTGDDAFMLVPYKVATTEAALGGVYAELPKPSLPRGGFPDLFTERQMRDFADRTYALRMEQAASKAAQEEMDKEASNARLDIDSNSTEPEQQRDVACSLEVGQHVGNGEHQEASCRGPKDSELLKIAARNLKYFIEHAKFSSFADKRAALNCLDALAAPQQEAQEPVAHDEDLLEQMYWDFDSQRKKTGEERLAFKGKMRSYASGFRRRSVGQMVFAQSVSDDMMNLADRLGSEFDDVDPRAWKHLLVYAPKAAPAQPAPQQEAQEPWGYARKMPGCGWVFCSKRQYEEAVADGDETKKLYATPQPAPAPLSDDVVKDAARLDWLALAGPTSICVVIDRPHDSEVEVATDDVTGYGKTLREALDAAIAAQGGKA